jgi:MFS family permease
MLALPSVPATMSHTLSESVADEPAGGTGRAVGLPGRGRAACVDDSDAAESTARDGEEPPLAPDLRSNLRASLGDATSFGVMVGVGETYLPAFVLAVGLGEVTAGMVASLPMLAGGVMQLISPTAVRRLGSHRRWVVLCATLQATSFLPLVLAALAGGISRSAVLLIATLYWGAGMATGPAWNTWIETLVPSRVRARFFARRTRLNQAAVLSGFILGGVLLRYGSAAGKPLLAFAVLFGVASLCRVLSASCLFRQSEPVPIPPNMRRISPRAVLKRLKSEGGGGRLLLYMVVVQAAIQISGPYFTPYMLQHLRLTYTDYVSLLASSFVAKIVALPIIGRFAHSVGPRRLLWLGGVGIVPVSGMWIFSDSFGWLLVVQMLAGTVWATWELATFLLFFESIPREERTSLLTLFNLGNAAALVTGALLGALALKTFGATREVYLTLFAASSVARAATLVLLWRVPAMNFAPAQPGLRTMTLRPSDGAIDPPILPSIPPQEGDAEAESEDVPGLTPREPGLKPAWSTAAELPGGLSESAA